MIPQKLEKSLVKYLNNEASSKEIGLLTDWVLTPEGEKSFEAYVKFHYNTITAVNEPDTNKIKEKLFKEIRKNKIPKYSRYARSLLRYAAIGVIFLVAAYFYLRNHESTVDDGILIPAEEPITITLDNGKREILEVGDSRKLKDSQGRVVGSHDSTALRYDDQLNTDHLIYNTINIPKGKKYSVVLSDGTKVYLNSGASLRYPVKFLKKHQRNVTLKGEGFFDVVKSEQPFVVTADDLKIAVLGTKFNISNYDEDTTIQTVLVEGMVGISSEDDTGNESRTLLKPGTMGEWNGTSKKMNVKSVDTQIYTSWIDGRLIFRNASFLKIRQTLERHYNVDIENSNIALDEQFFDATFDVETIQEVLESFNRSFAIEYEIRDNKVIIK